MHLIELLRHDSNLIKLQGMTTTSIILTKNKQNKATTRNISDSKKVHYNGFFALHYTARLENTSLQLSINSKLILVCNFRFV